MKLIPNIALLILLLNISCSNERALSNQIKYIGDIEAINLEAQNLNIGNIFDPNGMIVIDSLLVIVDSRGEFCFHVFNASTFKPVAEFGRKGRGPDEFIDPVIINEAVNTGDKNGMLSVYDRARRQISYISLSEIVSRPDFSIISESLPTGMQKVSSIIFMNDSIAIYIPYDEGHTGRFSIYDFSEENQIFTPYLPDLGFKIHPNNLYPVYATSSFCVDESRSMFVAIPALLGELDFFDLSGKYLYSSVIERRREIRKTKEEQLVFNVPGVYYYMTSISAVDERIYALICRKEYPDFKNVSNSHIYVFDWDGNSHLCFALDREISQLAYDHNNNRFIGFSRSDVDLPFVRYELE